MLHTRSHLYVRFDVVTSVVKLSMVALLFVGLIWGMGRELA